MLRLWNRARLNYAYLSGGSAVRALPTEITIEPTNRCTLSCVMCPRRKMTRSIGHMDISLFKKIINEAAGFAEIIDLDLYGESTLHPRLGRMIGLAHECGLKTLLSTNMVRMPEKMMRTLLDSGLDMLYISIDGAKRETYERIRRGAGYEDVVANTKWFLSLKGRSKPYTTVQMIYMQPNAGEGREFLAQWRDSGADEVRLKPYLTLDRGQNGLSTTPPVGQSKPCIMPWRRLVVCWDGRVVPCCNDYDALHVVGDVNEQSLKEVWNSEKMRSLRKLHAGGRKDKVALCRGCRPFEASTAVVLASTFTPALSIKKLLPAFERRVVFKMSRLLRYS